MTLSKADVDAVIDYVWQHARGSKNGRAYKVWEKMFQFQNNPQPDLFEKQNDKPGKRGGTQLRKN